MLFGDRTIPTCSTRTLHARTLGFSVPPQETGAYFLLTGRETCQFREYRSSIVPHHTPQGARAATGGGAPHPRSDRSAARVVNPVDPFGFNFTQSYTKHVVRRGRTHRSRTREELDLEKNNTQLSGARHTHATRMHVHRTRYATLAFAPQFALIARYERALTRHRASSQAMTHGSHQAPVHSYEHVPHTTTQSPTLRALSLTKGPTVVVLVPINHEHRAQEHAYEICGTEGYMNTRRAKYLRHGLQNSEQPVFHGPQRLSGQ